MIDAASAKETEIAVAAKLKIASSKWNEGSWQEISTFIDSTMTPRLNMAANYSSKTDVCEQLSRGSRFREQPSRNESTTSFNHGRRLVLRE
jgi:hypothetical protein